MGTSPYGRNRDNAPLSFWPALGQTEDVQMLLQFGADPTLLDRYSQTPMDVLKRNKNFKAIEKINSHLEKLAACSKDLSGTASRELTFGGMRVGKTGSVILDTNRCIFSWCMTTEMRFSIYRKLVCFSFCEDRMREPLFREHL